MSLQLNKISHSYTQGGKRLDILRGVDLRVGAGEMVALVAPSGAGKSTLLHIAGLLEQPQSGSVVVNGQDCGNLPDAKRSALRAKTIGFVYQFHHLLPEFSAMENILLPQMILGTPVQSAQKRARDLLARAGLADRADHRPSQLSGGEQQRVAILRALANNPKVLLADEPTGNLDAATGDSVFALLQDQVREHNMAALIVTHNMELAKKTHRILSIRDGIIFELESQKKLNIISN